MSKLCTARSYIVWVMVIAGLTLFGCNKKVVKTGATGQAAGGEEVAKTEMDIKGKVFSPEPSLGTVHFDFDSYTINPEAREVLIKNAEWIQANPDKEILIAGHCNDRGTVEYNLALGDKRAKPSVTIITGQGSGMTAWPLYLTARRSLLTRDKMKKPGPKTGELRL